jgi:hypothetical protein
MTESKVATDDLANELRHLARADPFLPFEITRSSGKRHVVTTSDHIAMNQKTVVVIAPGSGILHFPVRDVTNIQVKSIGSAT